MTVEKLADVLRLRSFTASNSREVKGAYCCDLLSNALVKLKDGDVWLTVMNNVNVAAVAYSKNVSCILLTEGIGPDATLLKKAIEYNISILGSELTTYETAILVNKYL